MNAQALLVPWPSMSFLIKLQSRSCVAVWATFIFPWWVEGTASSQEVRLLFLLVRGTEKGPHTARRHSPRPFPAPARPGLRCSPRSCSLLLLTPQSPSAPGGWRSSAQLSSHPWAPKHAKPGALISLWNFSRLSLSPFTSHTHHTLHTLYHKCIQDIHCIPFTQTFSHLCTHMQKNHSHRNKITKHSHLHKA